LTYCDDLEEIKKTEPRIVTLYESNKNGDRFKKTTLNIKSVDADNLIEDETDYTITIDRNTQFQEIFGFGGAFTDAAGLNLLTLPVSMAERVMEDYFSATGLEYSFGRVPIGGSDYSTRPYSYDDTSSGDMRLQNFSLTMEDNTYKV